MQKILNLRSIIKVRQIRLNHDIVRVINFSIPPLTIVVSRIGMTLNLLEIESVLEVRALKVVALIVDYDGVVGVSPPSIEHCAL